MQKKILIQGINQAVSEALGEGWAKQAYYADFSTKEGSILSAPAFTAASGVLPTILSSLTSPTVLGYYENQSIINNTTVTIKACIYSSLVGGVRTMGISVSPYYDSAGTLHTGWLDFVFHSVSYNLNQNSTAYTNKLSAIINAGGGWLGTINGGTGIGAVIGKGAAINALVMVRNDTYDPGWNTLVGANPWLIGGGGVGGYTKVWLTLSRAPATSWIPFPTNIARVNSGLSVASQTLDAFLCDDILFQNYKQIDQQHIFAPFGSNIYTDVDNRTYAENVAAEAGLVIPFAGGSASYVTDFCNSGNSYQPYRDMFSNLTVTFYALNPRLSALDADYQGNVHVGSKIYSFGATGIDLLPLANGGTAWRAESNLKPPVIQSNYSQASLSDLSFAHATLDLVADTFMMNTGNAMEYFAYVIAVWETVNGEFGLFDINNWQWASSSSAHNALTELQTGVVKAFLGAYSSLDNFYSYLVRSSGALSNQITLIPRWATCPSNIKKVHLYVAWIPRADIQTYGGSTDNTDVALNQSIDIPDDRFLRAATFDLTFNTAIIDELGTGTTTPPGPGSSMFLTDDRSSAGGSGANWLLIPNPYFLPLSFGVVGGVPNQPVAQLNPATHGGPVGSLSVGDSFTETGFTSASQFNVYPSIIVRVGPLSYAVDPVNGLVFSSVKSGYGNSLNTFAKENYAAPSDKSFLITGALLRSLFLLGTSSGLFVYDATDFSQLNQFKLVLNGLLSLLATREGAFALTASGIFLTDGDRLMEIGDPIRDVYLAAYPNVNAALLEPLNTVLLNVNGDFYAFNLTKKKWSHFYNTASASQVTPIVNQTAMKLVQGSNVYIISPVTTGGGVNKKLTNQLGYIESNWIPMDDYVALKNFHADINVLSTGKIVFILGLDTWYRPIVISRVFTTTGIKSLDFPLPPISVKRFKLYISYSSLSFEIREIAVEYEKGVVVPHVVDEASRQSIITQVLNQ